MKHLLLIYIMICLGSSLHGQTSNPFDIYHKAKPVQDSIQITEPTPVTVEDVIKIEGSNPFDISHIPIRKNQIQEIESLSFKKDDQNKETIEIGYWPLWILALSLILLAVLIYLKKDHFITLVRSAFNENYMRMTQYEQNAGLNAIYLLGYLIFILNVALFIYLILSRIFGYIFPYQFGYILLTLLVLYLGKHVVNFIFSKIFFTEKENEVYDFTIISFYNILAPFFVILNILVVFGISSWHKPLAVAGVFIYILLLIARYYKGLRIGRKYVNDYFFHFFIYFCAFEFSPWVIVYTYVKDLFL
ncbi:MAG: DUF4271 domain-containing protein [Saprospiraceae bacterium]|nr:DUF4271 domain-containing protein [Saprospiraceae bacterium]